MKLTESQLLEALGNLPERLPVDIATSAYLLRADIIETVKATIERNCSQAERLTKSEADVRGREARVYGREQAVEKAERHWRKLHKALKSLEVDE